MSDPTLVELAGLDRAAVLHALWAAQRPAAFYSCNGLVPPLFDFSAARSTVAAGPVDYFCGRCINLDLRRDAIDTRRFDASVGKPGTAQRAIARLRVPTSDW